jgi:DNA gyrase subunit A
MFRVRRREEVEAVTVFSSFGFGRAAPITSPAALAPPRARARARARHAGHPDSHSNHQPPTRLLPPKHTRQALLPQAPGHARTTPPQHQQTTAALSVSAAAFRGISSRPPAATAAAAAAASTSPTTTRTAASSSAALLLLPPLAASSCRGFAAAAARRAGPPRGRRCAGAAAASSATSSLDNNTDDAAAASGGGQGGGGGSRGTTALLDGGGGGGDGGGGPPPGGRVEDRELADEASRSYLAYAMSVIVGRALPDARDGLKPVHRRILYAMHELGLAGSKPHRKCARVVGEVLGKYHPHGDQAVYDALVRMAQPFSMLVPLVSGHGNFGSLDDDPPAAMRYTECRLASAAEDSLLDGLEEETVDFAPTFDAAQEEPLVLPAKVPLLLVNGAQGIAVGIATKVPPHNLAEVVAAARHLALNPRATSRDLMAFVPAPDFPTGGEVLVGPGAAEMYETGSGSVVVRAKIAIETDDDEDGGGGGGTRSSKSSSSSAAARRRAAAAAAAAAAASAGDAPASSSSSSSGAVRIVVTELPYQTCKSDLVARVAELVDDKVLDGISDVRDESDRDGVRVVVEVKRGFQADAVRAQLLRHTRLQQRFSANVVALVGGAPRSLPLRDALQTWLDFRAEVVERRAAYRLRKAKTRLHVVEGLLLAMTKLDAVVAAVRAAADGPAARQELCSPRFGLSPEQADAVLALTLRRLTALEAGKLQEEAAALTETAKQLEALLADRQRVLGEVVREAQAVADKHAVPRRSRLRYLPGAVVVVPPPNPSGGGGGGGGAASSSSSSSSSFHSPAAQAISAAALAAGVPRAALEEAEAQAMAAAMAAGGSGNGTASSSQQYASLVVPELDGDGGLDDDAALVPNVPSLLLFSRRGFIKRVPADAFGAQRRGGRGKAAAGARTKSGTDALEEVAAVMAHDRVMFVTESGRALVLPAYRVPEASRTAGGAALAALLALDADDRVAAVLPLEGWDGGKAAKVAAAAAAKRSSASAAASLEEEEVTEEEPQLEEAEEEAEAEVEEEDGAFAHPPETEPYVVVATATGRIKRSPLSAFGPALRRTGTQAIKLAPGDRVVAAAVAKPPGGAEAGAAAGATGATALLASSGGRVVHFPLRSVRGTSRAAGSIRGMKLFAGEELVAMCVLSPEEAAGVAAQRESLAGLADEEGDDAAVLEEEEDDDEEGAAARAAASAAAAVLAGAKGRRRSRSVRRSASGSPTVDDGPWLLLVGSNGVGKRVPLHAFAIKGRGTQGVMAFRAASAAGGASAAVLAAAASGGGKKGGGSSSRASSPSAAALSRPSLVHARVVPPGARAEVLVATKSGLLTRCSAADVPALSRSARGSRVMRVGAGDAVAAFALLPEELLAAVGGGVVVSGEE